MPSGDAATVVLYHATNVRFDKIDLSRNRRNLDFNPEGRRCFYLGNDFEAALDWAVTKGGQPVIYRYTVNGDELIGLKGYVFYSRAGSNRLVQSAREKPKSGEHNLEGDRAQREWERFVTEGRRGKLSHSYDYVEGPTLLNPAEVQMGRKAKAGKHQLALCTAAAAGVFNRSQRERIS